MTDSPTDPFAVPPRFAGHSARFALAVKRFMDLAVAGVGLLALSPFLAIIALLVLLDSGWPILYAWKVVGRGGRYFTGYKFRTMVRDADRMQIELHARNEMTGPVFKMKNDPRVTRVGRVLRRYSLDELPQLWSVLVGDMSLVGPRPPLQSEYERFLPWQRRKLAVTPGLTCLWQARGRADIPDFDTWVRMDLEYIDTWRLGLDLRILAETMWSVVRGRGAY